MESSRYFLQVVAVLTIFLVNCSQAFNIDDNCPRIFHQVFNGYAPLGNLLIFGLYNLFSLFISLYVEDTLVK